jgi:hypothetical protein
LLITDWAITGLQPLSVSYLGPRLGAAFGWNVADAGALISIYRGDARRSCLLSRRRRAGTGRAAYDVGDAYRHAGACAPMPPSCFERACRSGSFPRR